MGILGKETGNTDWECQAEIEQKGKVSQSHALVSLLSQLMATRSIVIQSTSRSPYLTIKVRQTYPQYMSLSSHM